MADIFKRLGIVEQTGHGVPTIIKKYGENAFDIKGNYINVVIPFDKEVIANHGAISGAISGVNSGFNKGEQSIIDLLKANPSLSAKELSQTLNIPFRSIQRYISHLKDKGAIRRNGSNKTGYWEVL